MSYAPAPVNFSAARHNNSTTASFRHTDLENPFASGSFRWVALGEYTVGRRKGQKCVAKWFKDEPYVYDKTFYAEDINAVNKAIDIINRWNQSLIINKKVWMNRVAVWEVRPSYYDELARKCLIEPYIQNFDKFNSNTGWSSDGLSWGQVMQALSHFSYHATGGNFLLCDLQGGVYKDGIVLTDPVIHSRRNSFGLTDLGAEGMLTFFHRHNCNKYCNFEWSQPARTGVYFPMKKGTTMIHSNPRIVTTRFDREAILE